MITGSVRLTQPLGKGGMASVWLAHHLGLDSQVVVKFMNLEYAADQLSRDRFTREAAAASRVKSPHVVQMFDHGITADGVPFIIMELLEGNDLSHRIRQGPLPLPLVVSVLRQVGQALERAHAVGIIHRDIKPENIFLCEVGADEPFVKLLDFGIAKATHSEMPQAFTQSGAIMGSPYYMSPEQFSGARNIDARTDLWSLGIVAFECLTGVRPFRGETIGALAIAVHSGKMPVPSQARYELSSAIDAWFLRACDRDPARRFESAKQFASAFAEAARIPAPTGRAPRVETMALPFESNQGPLPTTGRASSLAVATAVSEGSRAPYPRRRRAGIAAAAVLGVGALAGLGLLVRHAPPTVADVSGAAASLPSTNAKAKALGSPAATDVAPTATLEVHSVASTTPSVAESLPSPSATASVVAARPVAAHPVAAPPVAAPRGPHATSEASARVPAPAVQPRPRPAEDPFQPHVF